MGVWSEEWFGNDTALDFLGRLEDADNLRTLRKLVSDALHAYDEFLLRKAKGENVIVWTAEVVQQTLRECGFTEENWDDPEFAEAKQGWFDMEGKTTIDDGEYAAFESIASAAATLGACRQELKAVREVAGPDLKLALLDKFRPTADELHDALRVLNLIKANKTISRTCGARWKKQLVALANDLAACCEGETGQVNLSEKCVGTGENERR